MVSCDRSNESYWAVRSCGTVGYAVQGGFNFWVWMKSYGVTIQMKATDYYVPVVLFVVMYKMVLPYLELYLKSYCVTFQMNTLHQYFHIVLLLYQDVLIAWSFDLFFFVFQCNLSEMKTGLSDCSFCFCVIRNPHLLKAPVSRIERLILNILQVSNRTVLKTTLKKVTATLKKRCCMQISY